MIQFFSWGLDGASERKKNGLHPCPPTGLLVGTWAVTVDGGSGIPG